MVRVVGKEGALGAGVGVNCSSGMDGSKKITKRYSGRGKCLLLWQISILGGAFKREEPRKYYIYIIQYTTADRVARYIPVRLISGTYATMVSP